MDDKFVIESFWQKADNCATVAIIKAAILKYGINRVFRVRKKLNSYIITFRDKKIITLTDSDLRSMNSANDLVFSRYPDKKKKEQLHRLKSYVRLCFAAIVRNIQLNGYQGKEYTESEAINDLLLKGLDTSQLHRLLGLLRKTRSAHRFALSHLKKLRKLKGVLVYSDDHIVVASSGYYEDFGTAVPLGDYVPVLKGKKAKYWYELR